MNSRTLISLFTSLAALGSALPCSAADPESGAVKVAEKKGTPLEQYFMQDYMLGNWGGLRSDLAANGVEFEFFYVGSAPSNISGGIRAGTEYQHGFLAALDLDTTKLGLWKGGHLHVSGVNLEGRPFSATHVGDLNKTNLVDFPADTRLWQFWYSQDLLDGKLQFKAGLMSVDRDFILPEMYNSLTSINFLNQTFFFPTMAFNLYDIPGFPVGNHSLPSTPYGSLGFVVKWHPTDVLTLQAGIYDGNPDQSSSGTRLAIREDEGPLYYFEAGFRINQGKGDTGLPGNIKVGGYYHTDEFYDIYDTATALFGLPSTPRSHGGNYGAYVLAEQMLWRETTREDPAQQGMVGFFRVMGAPQDRNLAEFGIDGGLVFKGPIPSRDWDALSIGVTYLKISDDVARAQRALNAFVPGALVEADYEAAIEVNYKLQLAAWWTVSTSLQYVMHPGGGTAPSPNRIPNAWVLGVQTTLRF